MRSYQAARIFQSSDQGEGIVKSAIVVLDATLDVIQYPQLTTNNIVVLGIKTKAWHVTLVSVYLDKENPIESDLEHLTKIARKADNRKLIIGGDMNAWNMWWGSVRSDPRGECLREFLDEMDLQVLNSGSTPTFDCVRGGKRYSSHVDVTVCSTDMVALVEDWKVEENLTCSDHNGITFKLSLQKSLGTQISRTTRIYNTRKASWDRFNNKFDQLKEKYKLTDIQTINNTETIEKTVINYTKSVTQACRDAIPKIKQKQTLTLPWWSEKLAEMRREVTTRRRRIRNAAPVRRSRVVQEYLEKKEIYELEVKKAKVESWKEFCGKQDREGVWEGIYRVIGRTKAREEDILLQVEGLALDAQGSAKTLAETFYPEDLQDNDNADHRTIRGRAERVNDETQIGHCDPPFTLVELRLAVNAFNPKKAPGADGFTADICAKAIHKDPNVFLNILNKCLEYGYFPSQWKRATVVVLKKPGKSTYTTPKSYRPIGLLPVLGKIFEKMLVARLKFHLLPRMSTRQFGFMPQRCTEDSLYTIMQYIHARIDKKKILTMVSLDIEGAFDSAWWPAIRVRLAEEECPINLRRVLDSYLSNREVTVRYAGEEHTRKTSKGCVQGSIGGPILWNLLLDPLLKELETRGDFVQAFADDIVLIFEGDTAQEIQDRANAALEHVRAWGVRNKLKFAPNKTMAMVITRKLKYDTPRLSMGGVSIGMTKEIKLLGLTIDAGLTFNAHAANVCRKSLNFYRQLSRAAKVQWGLQSEVVRSIYVAVVEPTIMYAASAWAPATYKLCIQNSFNSVQRGFIQKIIKAYKTVSLNSALLLAGLLPLDIRVREAASLYEAKKGYSRRVVGDREVEKPVPYTEAPHPASQLELTFQCLADGAALEQHFDNGLNIFTDGSKIEGKVGAALSIWNGAAEISTRKLKLDKCCTVYQAELLALCEATAKALKTPETSCNIYCDSRSALETVTNPASLHPLAVKARQNILKLNEHRKILRLFWIKAHAGLEGNERADTLAKSAALYMKARPNYDNCPVSFAKRQIRMESLDEWNRRYQSGETASTTKVFFPDAIQAYPILKKIELDHIVVQLLTGHGGFSSYLHRFKCKESPACDCDPETEQSALHIITDCPMYAGYKYDIENILEIDVEKENLCNILKDKNIRIRFIEYCKMIIKKVVDKNKTDV